MHSVSAAALAEDSLVDWLSALRDGKLSASGLTDAVLKAARDAGGLGCFVNVFDAAARDAAQMAARPDADHLLAGVPLSVKDDLFCAGLTTTGGSPAFAGFVPDADCVAVGRLRRAGAIVFAKSSLPEFAMNVHPYSPLSAWPLNPWDPSRTAGASSGGAAASIAAGVGAVAVATDTGGSIRLPASFCGLIGFMPSNGRVPRGGGFGSNRTLMGIGAIGRSVDEVRVIVSMMSGSDRSDPETQAWPQRIGATTRYRSAFRFAYVSSVAPLVSSEPEVGDAMERMVLEIGRLAGVTRVDLALDLGWAAHAFAVVSDRERFECMSREGTLAESRVAQFTQPTRLRLAHAATVTDAAFAAALQDRRRLGAQVADIFDRCDFLLTPTVPCVAPAWRDTAFDAAYAQRVYGNLGWVNLAGCPAITIPLASVGGLPAGMQIIGRPGADDDVLDAADFIMRAMTGSERAPIAPRARWAAVAASN
jgi:Asp-tRNA(Asn)/Glu-tRNA(Gln) amidotransferase A subunit family amidase